MKKIMPALIAVAIVIIATGVVSLLSREAQVSQVLPPSIQLVALKLENPPFNFSFEFPGPWRQQEDRYVGKFDMVGIQGPKDEETQFVVSFFVTKKPLQSGQTPESMADAFLTRLQGGVSGKNFQKSNPMIKRSALKVLSRREMELSAGHFYRVDYQKTESLPLYSTKRKQVVIKNTEIFTIRSGSSFQLSFSGTEEQYRTYQSIFDHILKTFKFLD